MLITDRIATRNPRTLLWLMSILTFFLSTLLAAMMGMYDLNTYPIDAKLWEFLAYSAGTGGSLLVIGSAAGGAVMEMERLEFGWYFRRISGLALLGYIAGALVQLGIYAIIH